MIVALGICCLVLFAPEDGSRRAVAAYKQQLLAQGEKLSFAELAPPPSTNSPDLAGEFTNSPGFPGSVANLPSAMIMIAPGIATAGHLNKPSEPFYDYDQNVRVAAELRAILDRAAVLDFNLDYSKGAELPLPHLAPIKRVGILFSATAVQALYQQDHAVALPNLYAGADLIRLSCNEPIMISGLVRAAMMALAVRADWEALQDKDWTDPQLAQLQAKWEAIDLSGGQEAIIRMELAGSIDSLAKARKDRDWANNTLAAVAAVGGGPTAGASATSGGWLVSLEEKVKNLYEGYRYRRWKTTWSYEEELYDLQTAAAALKAARRVRDTGAFVPAMNDLKQQMDTINKLHPDAARHFLLGGLIGGFGGIFDRYFAKMARAESSRRLLVTAIALKRYQLQHTNYPPSLNDLVPNRLARVPVDLMDGKPLRYRLNPDGSFLLYSVGDDGEDNGGDASLTGTTTNLNNWPGASRDFVWPRAATPAEAADYYNHAASHQCAE